MFKNFFVETEYLKLRIKSIVVYEHARYWQSDQCLCILNAGTEGQQYVARSLHASACGYTFLCTK